MATIQAVYELSPMQQGMLFHTLYAPESSVYFEQRHCILEGSLDRRAFRQAWQQVVNRYDVLRSEFHWEETDKPLQVVYDTVALPWTDANWQSLSPLEQTEKLESFLGAERLQGFHLDRAPLMRCALFQLNDHQSRFVWSYHHLLMDGWCNGVLIKEVLAIYQADREGKPCYLPPVKPYQDYIVWLQQQDSAQAQAYWHETLKGFEMPTPLGIDRLVGKEGSIVVDNQQEVFLSEAFSESLQAFARRSRLTLNTLLQGAWAILLSRYSGLSDVVFGVTVSGRPPTLSGVESMVGLFINSVPLRSQLPQTAVLLPWLQQLQQAQRDREAYSYSALTDIQAWSNVPRGLPLFESLLVFENYPVSIEAATQSLETGLTLKDGQGYEQTNYPLTLVVIPGEVIHLSLRYDNHRLSKTIAVRLLGHLEVVLKSFVEHPEQSLAEVPLLTLAEQQQLDEIATGKAVNLSPLCVYQQFERQATTAPNASAITFSAPVSPASVSLGPSSLRSSGTSKSSGAQTFSYQQLNQRANRIAHYLSLQGVQKGTRVGICLDRSLDLVASLLAILKAGGIYIPLDASYPAERLIYVIQDAQIELLITTTSAAEALSTHLQIPTVYLDKQDHLIALQPSENLSYASDEGDLAYILYTSGSTGKPKGVPVCHRSLTNFLSSMAADPGITSKDTLLAVTTLAFDIAALEIFLPLVAGAHLVMTPREVTLDGEQLAAHLATYGVTIMQATPATWRLLLNVGWQGSAELKMLCGGETLDLALAQQLLPCGRELWNLYGPTETTIWSGIVKIDEEILAQETIPIGLPIANTQFYVLDEQQRRLPMGVAGELYIGGLGLSPGYWNRADLTAQRFVAIPSATDLSTVSATVFYRTGDRVRYREDGTLDYLGRLDNQVKLRGFRIELGEIETRLAQHPQVTQAVAMISQGDNPQLVAYLVLTSEAIADELADELRQQLSQQLPAYMLPTGYSVLKAFPLTANGKVDRRSLPPFNHSIPSAEAPRTPTEKLIAGVWAEVLGCDRPSLNDNFFALGGHSLLATRVIAQLRQVFGTEVPLRSLFENPTLSEFVAIVQQAQGQQAQSPPFPSILRTDQFVLSYAQQRQWLIAQLAPESSAYAISTAIRIKGELSPEGLRQSLAQVISRHETLRTLYMTVEGKAVPTLVAEASLSETGLPAQCLPGASIELALADLSRLDEMAKRAEIARNMQHAQRPFDLPQGPLWRSQLLYLSDREHILLFTLHHIVADGWSMGLLLKELTAFYQAHQAGKNLAEVFPPLPIRYRDYAIWQKSLDLTPQLTYWQQQLSGIEPLLVLPTDYPRPAEPAVSGAIYEFRLSRQETDILQKFSQQNSVTLFMTLLAAFQVLLYRYSGLCDLVVGTPIANRQQAELEALIGLFVNTLVIRTQIKNNPRFSDFLAQVRSVTLEAYSHQDLPFEKLVDELGIPRSQSHTPLVQVMFSLQNTAFEGSSLSGLDWEPLANPLAESTAAKFDLALDMRETERGLIGRWEYRPDLFSADTIHRLAGHFRTLLKALPEAGGLRLSAMPMLSRHEVQQLQCWQQRPAAQSLAKETVHELFEAQVIATPEAIALTHNQIQFTYQALNQRANQLAHYLQQQGVTLETPVGLWAERSPAIIIAILAILKAGGTYIPLDPHYPVDRLAWMVKDTQMALLIEDLPYLPIPSEIQAIVPTIDLSVIAGQLVVLPTTNLAAPTDFAVPTSLAYILYTSGSTGQPKGVCTTHQGITRLVKSPNYLTLAASDILLQAAPLTFDAATFEIWGALLNGGRLVLLSAQFPSLQDLAQAISGYHITTLWLTAGLFNLMVDEQLNALQSVRQLLAGGDVLSVPHLRKALKVLKNTRIINGYGPTEGTTFTCCHTITEADLGLSVPIGYPLPHTQVYVLDADLQQIPAGIPGELYIGGAGLARGYLNRPELTAERFIPNPFGGMNHPFATLYKTGDRARFRADGALEYLGRLDQQIKVRGFRIELGEIEAALAGHPAIQQVAVMLRAVVMPSGDRADQKRLVAYLAINQSDKGSIAPNTQIISGSQAPLKPLALREFLLEKLPDYMVPTQFVWLSALPLTSHGKVDRRSLPTPQWEMALESNGENSGSITSGSTAPSTDTEQTLLEIFCTLLPAKSIGIHDNFFELGGDSILAMQIVSRAAQAGLTISPKQLFQYQTIAELASVAQLGSYTAISQMLATGEVPLVPIQHWFFEQSLAVPEHFNQSVCLALPHGFSRAALAQAIAQIYQHHDALRLRFTPTQSIEQNWQQQFAETMAAPAIQWFNFSDLSLSGQDSAIAQQAQMLQTSLNLQTGPLVRVGGFDLGTARASQLLIVIHHLVVDGVSWRILLADLQQAYQQAVTGNPIQLAPKTHSYQQWSHELIQLANSVEIEADRDYWQALVQSTPVDIPQDGMGEENKIESAERIVTMLPVELTQSLLQKVPSVYNTQITEALLTALVQTLTQWTGHSHALLALESHGRFSESLDLSRTVGWFTTLYPISLTFDATQLLADNFKAIKAQLRAVPNQGLSYGLLYHLKKHDVKKTQALAVTPPISFNYLGQIDILEKSGFERIPTSSPNQAAANIRPHLLDINCWIESGKLKVEWTYSRHYHTTKTVDSLAESFHLNLSALIEHCCAQDVADYSPDDFSLVQLDQSALDAVFSQVSFAGEQEAKR